MMFGVAVLLYTVAAVAVDATLPNRRHVRRTYAACRVLPGDETWPSESSWATFNASIDGRLIKTVPIANVCHGATFDHSKCAYLQQQWDKAWIHTQDPAGIASPLFQNGSCDPFTSRTTSCTVGNLASYSVNVSSSRDVVHALRFARENNIRLTIKNTGHDFLGKSTGKGTLSIWTHFLNTTDILENYTSEAYAGPAVRLGAGTQAYQLYDAVHKAGYAAIGGTCPTVGIAGGYTQGGGHGALSSMYGLGADNVLEWEVITANGQHLTTSPTMNPDLHWALSGGGGGTFAVVLSLTTKLYKDGPTAGATLSFNRTTAASSFWSAVDVVQTSLEPFVDNGSSATYQITNSTFTISVTSPRDTTYKLEERFRPIMSTLNGLGIPSTFTLTADRSYFDHYVRYYGPLPEGIWPSAQLVTSRLIPRSVVRHQHRSLLTLQQDIVANGDWAIAGIVLNVSRGSLRPEKDANAVNPAWRKALIHQMIYSPWEFDHPNPAMETRLDEMTNSIGPRFEALTPGSATYLNEADFQQKDWKTNFYGEKYDRLLAIKEKYDPESILYARTAVGSDAWFEDGEHRLCRSEL